jgi:hypothetical protein
MMDTTSQGMILVRHLRNTHLGRRGDVASLPLTPPVRSLLDSGRYLVALEPVPTSSPDPSRADLVAAAEALGISVKKTWTKARIAEAIETAQDASATAQEPTDAQTEPDTPDVAPEAVLGPVLGVLDGPDED